MLWFNFYCLLVLSQNPQERLHHIVNSLSMVLIFDLAQWLNNAGCTAAPVCAKCSNTACCCGTAIVQAISCPGTALHSYWTMPKTIDPIKKTYPSEPLLQVEFRPRPSLIQPRHHAQTTSRLLHVKSWLLHAKKYVEAMHKRTIVITKLPAKVVTKKSSFSPSWLERY